MSKEEELKNWSDDDDEEEEEIEEESTAAPEEGAAPAVPAASTSPSSTSPAFGRPRRGGRFQGARGFREPREYPKYPIPDEPPFIARVVRLPHEMKARELQDFFEGTLKCKVEKIVTRFDGEHVKKGTFDVIFEDKQSLEIAIGYDKKSIQNMSVSIFVPPPHDPNHVPRQSYRRGGYHRGGFRGRHYDRRNFHHERAGEGEEHKEGETAEKKEGEEGAEKPVAEGEAPAAAKEEEKKEVAAEVEAKPLSKTQLAKLEKKKKAEEYKAKNEEKKKKKAAEAALKAMGKEKKGPAKPANPFDALGDEDDE